MKKVMIFGVFDGLHPGHIYFLTEARRLGDELIVVVARDNAVQELKHKKPKFSEKKRIVALRKVGTVSRAVLGDKKQGTYRVMKRYKPDIICFGYDQKYLEKDIKKKIKEVFLPVIRLVRLKSYRPRAFHTSILRKGRNVLQ